MALAHGVRRGRPLSGRPWVIYAYIRWKRYPVFGWNFWHVMVCRRSLSSLSPQRVGHLCCRGRMGACRGPARCGSQRSYSMATLSGSARSLVNVHVDVGVRVQATCAGLSGGTV